jgi:hypothetical protein
MCNCGKRAAAARAAQGQGPNNRRTAPVTPEPIIHDPILWGPHLWTAMHTLAEFVPAQGANQTTWVNLLTALRTSLPCPECTGHYVRWHTGHPLVRRIGITIMMRRVVGDIKEWILALHNNVNEGKGLPGWSAAAVTATYGGDRGARAAAVRTAIDAVRGMVGGAAIQVLDALAAAM